VWRTFTQAYAYLYRNFKKYILQLAVIVSISYAISYLFKEDIFSGAFLNWGVGGIIFCSFAVGVHRTVLLAEEKKGINFFRRDISVLKYISVSLLFIFLLISKFIPGAIVNLGGSKRFEILTFPVSLFCLVIYVRLLLSLPAVAIGVPNSLAVSWRLTKGNWFRMFALLALASLPVLAFGIFTLATALGDPTLVFSTPFYLAWLCVGSTNALILLVILSFSYHNLAATPSPIGETVET
jgi:hypothetical protein